MPTTAIVLRPIDPMALLIQILVDLRALLRRHRAISLSLFLVLLNLRLLLLQAGSFGRRQAAGLNPLADALLLIALAMVDAPRLGAGSRCGRLRQSAGRETK